MFCGLCEEACSTDALELTQDYEMALYSREGMVLDRSRAGARTGTGKVREMTPVATPFFFYFLSFTAIVSAIAVITRRNPVHAALSLIVTLLSLAGFYLMLYAPFRGRRADRALRRRNHGAVPVRHHAGEPGAEHPRGPVQQAVDRGHDCRAGARRIVAVRVSRRAGRVPSAFYHSYRGLEADNTQQIGVWLYGNYMLPFEIASLLLLVAIVGAVVMAKKRI